MEEHIERSILSLAGQINGRKGGSVKSKRKARAARKNGKLGGRPRGSKNLVTDGTLHFQDNVAAQS